MRFLMIVAWVCALGFGRAEAEDRIRAIALAAPPWGGACGAAPCITDQLFEEVGRRTGAQVEITTGAPAEIFAAFDEGAADFALLFWSDRLAAVAEREVVVLELSIGVRGAPGARFATLADLYGKRIGVLPGGRYEPAFDAADAIEKVEGAYAELMPAAAAGRLDGVAGPMASLAWAERENRVRLRGWLELRTEPVVLARAKSCNCDALAARVADTLAAMRAEGAIDRLLKDYRVIN